ncbi:hypothetical protein OMAG_001205 [Candidatus Omnitrophus magneticus]|uniref:Uncharacterized protein n=1 Tax=Candidatus Omnitrophus magneticus TaxID=1609969 RepID=A0A0F0CU63_9BACT|nr:hypothetical protein OMAG_001205 [Candidatus Omnitrophus magneticus]
MLRTQLLIPKWLDTYIEKTSRLSNLSKGEVMRAMMCLSILNALKIDNFTVPNFDKITSIFENLARHSDAFDSKSIKDIHDDLFFETRKTIQTRFEGLFDDEINID